MESKPQLLMDAKNPTSSNYSRMINVGSRKSQLALVQTNTVIEKLKEFYTNNPDRYNQLFACQPSHTEFQELQFNVVSMATTGDKILDKPLPTIGTKSLFTRELEIELLENRADFVVHSLKDLPTTLPMGLSIGAVIKRDDPDDTMVLKKSLASEMRPLDLLLGRASLPKDKKMKIGTSSQRRIAMIHRCNPNLECIDIRGNLNTRLAKLDNEDSEYAAIILARAGLDRMGWSERASCQLNPSNDIALSSWCHAVGQGAMAVECRSNDYFTLKLLSPIIDLKTTYEVVAERSMMKRLEAGCSVPLGVRSAWTKLEGMKDVLSLKGIVLSVDGKNVVEADESLTLSGPESTHTKTMQSLDFDTTGIDISKSRLFCPSADENMIKCSDLGIRLANKMISSGCLELLVAKS